MRENSQDKPFKPLKLTSMRSADTAKSAVVAPEVGPEVNVLAGTEPVVTPSGAVAPQAAGEPEGTAPGKAAGQSPVAGVPGKDAPKSASFNLVNFKVGGTKKKESDIEAKPVDNGADQTPVEPDKDSAAQTVPPVLSPSAATSGPAGMKPFKFLVQPMKPEGAADDGAHRPQEIKLSRASTTGLGPPDPAPSAVAAADEAARPGVFALKQSGPPMKAEVAPVAVVATSPRAPVAKPSAKPLVLILGVAAALVVVGCGVMIFLSKGAPAGPVAPVVVNPVNPASPVSPANAGTPIKPVESVAELKPVAAPVRSQPVVAPPVVTAPRTRNPALESWLAGAKVTTVTAQRVTMNDRIYTLGSAVNPEGTLRWIGRDSKTKDLLFIDNTGVVYARPAGGR